MSILFIHGSADLYGSAKILLQVVGICVREKREVIVVLPHQGILVQELKKIGVTVLVVNIGVLRRRYFTLWGLIGRIFLWASATIRLFYIIKKYRVSKIYINSANVVLGPILKRLTDLPLVWHLHEIVGNPEILTKTLTKLILRADKVIAVSKATKDFWSAQSDKLNVELLYNGIDTSLYENADSLIDAEFPFSLKKNPGVVLIGMVGRLQPWKGQEYFLDIMQAYFKETYNDSANVYAVMIGDPYPGYGHYVEQLKASIKGKGLSEKVFYLGYRNDIPAVLASIDLLVMPSILPDPLPTVVLEAMSSSKAVLATRQGGALEMVEEGVTGYLINIDKPTESALILHKVLSDSAHLKQLGTNGYSRVKQLFAFDSFEKNWLKLFHRF